ncbi:MAG: RagB/SusD family nutrient uptake outer membrane [Bacteroidales bacterium]
MDRYPKTSITEGGFFQNADDLKSYINGLYNDGSLLSSGSVNDYESDNVTIYSMSSDTWTMLKGTLSDATAGGWSDWGSLRSVNFFLQNAGKATGNEADINNYIGIARYMRAWFYIKKVQTYSDVPWTNKALASDDPDVYKPSDPRTLVVDSILSDLEYAVNNISADMGNKTRIHKYCALALLSRFCLYEGTYRKYHPELGLESTATRFLERAVSASEEIMNSGVFSIGSADLEDLGNGITGSKGFRALFQSQDLSDNNEVIQWCDFNKQYRSVGVGRIKVDFGLSRSLMETFLTKDGKPFTSTGGYETKPYVEVFKNRDPRMAETGVYPGYNNVDQTFGNPTPTYGGYPQLKFYPRDPTWRQSSDAAWEGIVIYRLGEVLLNYAEAKAELGQFTAGDADKSINKLRIRVGMPEFNAATETDNALKEQYPTVSDNNILAIRRERRAELACEGFRLLDLNRWYAGKLFGEPAQGIFIPALGAYDVTGDGIEDIAILQRPGEETPIASLPDDVKARLSLQYLEEANGAPTQFYLENGTSGHVMFTTDKGGRKWEEPKFYYRPIPLTQIVLNPALKQVFGW